MQLLFYYLSMPCSGWDSIEIEEMNVKDQIVPPERVSTHRIPNLTR